MEVGRRTMHDISRLRLAGPSSLGSRQAVSGQPTFVPTIGSHKTQIRERNRRWDLSLF